MNVHGSELKCKYLIKVNPSQVNKPAARETEDEMRVVEEVARGEGGRRGRRERMGAREGRKSESLSASGPKGWFLLPVFIS